MDLEKARKICEEIIKEHGSYCDYHEERREGEVRFVNLTLRLKIDGSHLPERAGRADAKRGTEK